MADTRVYYEIFPASFYDGNGDGVGDLDGIRAQIPYLKELGADGVWLMPIHPSPTYHKYDVLDYYAVAPEYGGISSFETLAEALHKEGMALLIDLVLNHSSSRHPWFLSALESLPVEPCGQPVCGMDPLCRAHNPYVRYYHFTQDAALGWRAAPGVPGWFYEGVFTAEMPDLNLDDEALRAEILRICAYWLDKGADGFRLDAAQHYFGEDVKQNNAFLRWLMGELRAIKPDVYVVGEVWMDAGTIAQYYESGISSLFNFPFAGADGMIVKAIRAQNGAAFSRKAADWQAKWAAYPGASDAPFLSNHDMARIAGTLAQKPEKLKLAASLYLTLPGTPFLYYGEEIGMTGSGRDENKRLPMLWDLDDLTGQCLPPRDADQTTLALGAVRDMLNDDGSLLRHYQTLLSLRKAYPALQSGILTPLETESPAICAYTLAHEGQTVYVLHNLSEGSVTLPWDAFFTPVASLCGELRREAGTLTVPPLSTHLFVPAP